MSLTKRIYDDELTNGSVVMQIPYLPSSEDLAQIEREQLFNHAMEGLNRMKNFWSSYDDAKRAFAKQYCTEMQNWLRCLYFDSEFLSFGSDADFANPEPDWNNEARHLDDRTWEAAL